MPSHIIENYVWTVEVHCCVKTICQYLKDLRCGCCFFFLVVVFVCFLFCCCLFFRAKLKFSPCFSFQSCDCSPVGALSSQCDLNTGCCFCRPEFSGDKCTECRLGYWNYPQCIACQCVHSGTDPQTCETELGKCSCVDRTGQCNCKVGQ